MWTFKNKIAIFALKTVVHDHKKQWKKEIGEHGPLSVFADMLGTTVDDGKVIVPAEKGSGYFKGIMLDNFAGLLFFNYHLNDSLIYQQQHPEKGIHERSEKYPYLLFQFRGCLADDSLSLNQRSVQISTMSINMEKDVMRGKDRSDLFITINSNHIAQKIPNYSLSPLLKSILFNERPLFFERSISKRIQSIITEITECDVPSDFIPYFLSTRVDELICRLLISLVGCCEQTTYPIHPNDLGKIYYVRDNILSNLHIPPVTRNLAQEACMSETKLKSLFKQVFGDSIFNYYEVRRIQKAAELLKGGTRTVSDVGYTLGFTNLSHFSRIFERVIGMKPKAYCKLRKRPKYAYWVIR
jgi:AraC-like DNA-binding protein